MGKHLYYFRPGEEARMLARCQFGARDGVCGATFTYPIKGYPWRRNVMKSYQFDVPESTIDVLFSEVTRIRIEYPSECLKTEQLFNDSSEKGNGTTRDRDTETLCYTIVVTGEDWSVQEQYGLRENSEALLDSFLYKTISKLIEPYEKLLSS